MGPLVLGGSGWELRTWLREEGAPWSAFPLCALGTLSPQFSSATRERLDEEAGKTPSDTHNK